jgi:hypothetical protein
MRTLGLPLCVVTALLSSFGCSRKEPSARERFLELQGTWGLLIRHDCEQSPIHSDTLTLHPDGTFDQETIMKDGRSIKSTAQRWTYMEKDSISLDRRKRWDSYSDPPEGIAELEVLIVQFGTPPAILINPDEDCLYVKQK